MKNILCLIMLSGFVIKSYGQFPVQVDSLYTFIKYNSILRNTVDWKSVDEQFAIKLKNAKSLKDTMQCFVSVLESLDDVHSQIYLNNQYFGHYPAFDDSTLMKIKPINDMAILLTNKIKAALLLDKVAYVRVPSCQVYNNQEINTFAQSLHDSIQAFSSQKVTGFIIDLRLNGGGNIYPMLSGLSSILGDRVVAYETDIDDNIVRQWEINNGNFIIGGYQATQISINSEIDFQKKPVVVLIGPVTKSSGSMTAIAFKGRQHTFFIGEPTADGYTTSNGYFQFAPNLLLNFATNFVADRNKIIYKSSVNPDMVINSGDNFENLLDDKKIQAAIQWLSEQKRQ
ncbi:MAG: hypothetical protein HUU34_11135 [Saprospiraceae bacterium]|nr:hypothetical protein [Saprospiraceae bacterium]